MQNALSPCVSNVRQAQTHGPQKPSGRQRVRVASSHAGAFLNSLRRVPTQSIWIVTAYSLLQGIAVACRYLLGSQLGFSARNSRLIMAFMKPAAFLTVTSPSMLYGLVGLGEEIVTIYWESRREQ